MNVLFVSSEVAPFSRIGGLADVAAFLPPALAQLGNSLAVVTPAYRDVFQSGIAIDPTDVEFEIPMSSKVVTGRLFTGKLPGSEVPVYFIDQPDYFDRPELYQERGRDYKDNCERFVFFCRAVLELIRVLELRVDVLHCNDWQTGLIPALLRIEYDHGPCYEDIATLMTIHNMAYQGHFWHWDMLLTGLDWKYFNWRQMEFFGNLNLLKTGLVFADAINTVSPTYAREIQSSPIGCGLEGVLQQRSEVTSGIINGVDYNQWDPSTDRLIVANYDVGNWRHGKAICKSALQRRLGLPTSATTPLVGFFGRLSDQKGCDLICAVMKRWLPRQDIQWVIIGTGDTRYHELFLGFAREHADKVATVLESSSVLAHKIESAADILLMPSRYEACGFNQLYSLKYGTVPVVRETGGLADTVTTATRETVAAGKATGFAFSDYEPSSLEHTLRHAIETYRRQPDTWGQIVETGMRQDWSWANSARNYMELYESIALRRSQAREHTEEAR